jgi:DNA processing protein
MNQVPAPAGDDAALLAKLRLSMVEGVGPRLTQQLLEHFGDEQAIFQAGDDELRSVPGIGPKTARAIGLAREFDVATELRTCAKFGVTLVPRGGEGYPRSLVEIPDPPPLLYVKGRFDPRDGCAVAIVGSRHATEYGAKVAGDLAGGLARAGVTVVSGLARGIDGVAHRAALDAGGRTIGVLGSGLGRIYPPEHVELGEEVARNGALVSELPVLTDPAAGTFPQRNRIISGISVGVVVVEAAFRSGALITARHAMEQGRDVFAVPGRIDSRMSHGCHQLIRDGAKLVETVDDILEELGPLVQSAPQAEGPSVRKPAELLLNENEKRVLSTVGETGPTAIDEVIARSELPTSQVLTILSVLEMRRLVRRMAGNSVVRI